MKRESRVEPLNEPALCLRIACRQPWVVHMKYSNLYAGTGKTDSVSHIDTSAWYSRSLNDVVPSI